MVHLREVFPYSAGIVLAFEYMPTDLASVIRDTEKRLTEVCAGLRGCVSHRADVVHCVGHVVLIIRHYNDTSL